MGANTWSVYKHTTPDGRVYIGTTSVDPKVRWNYGYGYRNVPFFEAVLEFGWNNIEHEILCDGLMETDAFELEKRLIAEYDSTDPRKGFNRSTGGDGSWGVKISEETRQRLAESHVGKNNPHNRSWNDKISYSNRGAKKPHAGVPKSEETRKKLTGRKSVIQFDLSGNEIARFKSITEAANSVLRSVSSIGKCCNGNTPTAGGYIWKFENNFNGGKNNG